MEDEENKMIDVRREHPDQGHLLPFTQQPGNARGEVNLDGYCQMVWL